MYDLNLPSAKQIISFLAALAIVALVLGATLSWFLKPDLECPSPATKQDSSQ